MGSKSSVVNQDYSQVHNDTLSGLSTTKGDNNNVSVQILDNDAIKESLQFAGRNSDGMFANVGNVLNTIGTFASKVIDNQQKQNNSTLEALTQTTRDATGNVKNAYTDAYTRSQNGGLKPETMILIVSVLAVVVLIVKK